MDAGEGGGGVGGGGGGRAAGRGEEQEEITVGEGGCSDRGRNWHTTVF